MSWMYILECNDATYYVGSTRDLDGRIWQHEQGLGALYTKRRRPVRLVYCEEFDRIDDAFAREKQVQGWSRRKRELLISGDFGALPEAARKRWGPTARRYSATGDGATCANQSHDA